jgi:NAD(P)-dependent dehydrogenase (short-subunit alcohol dehydrogenase family)
MTASENSLSFVAGLRILITGAAGLFGRALVIEAARQGATVAATGREPSISAASFPPGVEVIAADLAEPAECGTLVERAASLLGGLDVLINNAAVLIRCDFSDLSLDDLDRAWAVNLRAPILLMQAAQPHLVKSSSPAIVNVVSTAAFDGGRDHVSAYAMTKAGLVTATKAVAKEFGPLGIRVLCISPPTMLSQMQPDLGDEGRARAAGYNVFRRLADIDEVTVATLFSASPHASFLTGSTVDLTGTIG